jgi:DNA mismatch endonuclease (patch repair protein)
MDIYSPQRRSEIMSKIRSVDTKAEIKLRKALFALGHRYRKNVRSLPGTPDIVLPKHRYAIQVRGCFWHVHDCRRAHRPASNTDYWSAKLARNVARDRASDDALQADGWVVRVVWECEVESANGLQCVAAAISTELDGRQIAAARQLVVA